MMNRYKLHEPRPHIRYNLQIGHRCMINEEGIKIALEKGTIESDTPIYGYIKKIRRKDKSVTVMHDGETESRFWWSNQIEQI